MSSDMLGHCIRQLQQDLGNCCNCSAARRCGGDTDIIEADTVLNWFKIKITLMTSKMGGGSSSSQPKTVI